MRAFVESLKRLYDAKSVTDERLDSLLKAKKITEAELIYIKTGKL